MPLFRRKADAPAPVRETVWPPLPAPAPDLGHSRSLAAHRQFLLGLIEPLMPFGMALVDAVGLQVSESIHAESPVPGFDVAAVDGYAVRAADVRGATVRTPVRLPVDGQVWTGDDPLPPMTTRIIRAGQGLPTGADTVVATAITNGGTESVTISETALRGQNVCEEGSDIEEGVLLVEKGTVLTPSLVAVLAASGIDKVIIRPRPRVVVIAIGSELAAPGRALRPGEKFDADSNLLAAGAKALGAEVWRVGVVRDDAADVRQLLADQQIRADLIVVSGGLTNGPDSVVGTAIHELGPYDIAQVALEPGGWQGFGILGDDEVPVIMVPGEPVSAFIAFEAFVKPAILQLMGAEPVLPETYVAKAAMGMTSTEGVLELRRGLATENAAGLVVSLVGSARAPLLVSELPRSNALVLLHPETDFVAAGDEVDIWLLDD
jgi:molybdopterin molybdotransferase